MTKCCFNGPPQVQERVFAMTPPGKRMPYYFGEFIRLTGILHVKLERVNGVVTKVYTMDIEKYERV